MLIKKIKNLLNDALFKGGSIMTVAGVLGGILGYVYQIFMGRMLSPQEYSLFAATMALLMFAGSPLSALTMSVARGVAGLHVQGRKNILWRNFEQSTKKLMAASAISIPLFYGISDEIGGYLKTQSLWPVYLLGVITLIGAFYAVVSGFLQGLRCFSILGSAGVLGVTLKIVLSVSFVYLGYGVIGAITGILLSSLAVLFFSALLVRRQIYPEIAIRERKKFELLSSSSMKSFFPVLLANVAFTGMSQLDMVIVNNLFDAETAGNYAAASVLGKAVLYLPAGLAFALFPLVAENLVKNKSSVNLLFRTASATIFFCLVGAIFYYFSSDFLIRFFYGDRYVDAARVLRWYGFAIIPMSLVMVAENFLIAQGRVLFTWIFLAIAPLQVGAMVKMSNDPLTTVTIIGASGMLTAIIGYGFILWEHSRR